MLHEVKKFIFWKLLKLKSSAFWNTLLREWKLKAQTSWQHYQKSSGKAFVPEIPKTHLKLSNEKQAAQLKMGQNLNRHFTREDIENTENTWKDVW